MNAANNLIYMDNFKKSNINTDIKSILEGFKNHLIMYNKSEKTINNYMLFVNRFIKDNNIKGLEDLKCLEDYMFFSNYIQMLKNRGNCNNTINNRLVIISLLSNYLKRCRVLTSPIIKDISLLPCKKKDVTIFDEDEIQDILYAMKERAYNMQHHRHMDEINAIREYLMVSLMVTLGLRIEEVCLIRTFDIYDGKLDIRGKGHKGEVSRTLDIPENIVPLMEEWMSCREEITIKEGSEDYVFVSALTKSNVKARGMEKRLHQLEDELGIDEIHPHKFRHSFCSNNLHNERLTALEIKDIVGHTSVATTERYYISKNKESMKKTSTASLHYKF